MSLTYDQSGDSDIVDLMVSVLDSPYANYLIRQFVMTALTKLAGRLATSSAQQKRISDLLDSYANSLELEIQQRAVEYENLLQLGDIKLGVLERMPPPELKATVLGIGYFFFAHNFSDLKPFLVVENKPVGSTASKEASTTNYCPRISSKCISISRSIF